MFSKEEKNKEDQPIQEEGKLARDMVDEISKKGVVIHSMPRKFNSVGTQPKNVKNVGLLILAGGSLLLVVVLFALYFFIFNGDDKKVVEKEEVSKEIETKPAQKKKEEEKIIEVKKKEEPKDTGTTTLEDVMVEEEIEATTTPEVVVEERVESIDSDGDGLSDKEEALLGSDKESVDSDGDGYQDLSELNNLYNLAGGGVIKENSNVGEYVNGYYGYNLFYPLAWSFSEVGGEDSIVFMSDDSQFVQVISQPNAEGLSIEDWFKNQLKETFVPSSRKVSADTWEGIKSEDGLIIYITDLKKKNIITITYNSGMENSLDYVNIYNMIVKSFEIN